MPPLVDLRLSQAGTEDLPLTLKLAAQVVRDRRLVQAALAAEGNPGAEVVHSSQELHPAEEVGPAETPAKQPPPVESRGIFD